MMKLTELRLSLAALAVVTLVGCGGDDIGSSDDAYLRQVAPCAQGSCWDTRADVRACGFATSEESFASGAFNVHRYATQLGSQGTMRIAVTSLGGSWQPVVVVAETNGRVLYDGTEGVRSSATLVRKERRRGGGVASITIETDEAREVNVFVTSRDALASSFVSPISTDARYSLVVEEACDEPSADDRTAPTGAMPSDERVDAGTHTVSLGGGDWGPALRFDVPAGTYVGLHLASSNATLQVLQWTGSAVEEMASTDGAGGKRLLSVLDPQADRTYWVRARGTSATAQLTANYLPFREGVRCEDDCDRMMQLPLPNAHSDGYDMLEGAVYRRQFGRRDVLMSLRHAGRSGTANGLQPFTVEDLSNADGSRPPGHASHTEGKDVDLSVYDANGNAVWYPLCNETGDECISGTDKGMDYEAMALKIGALIEGERVTNIFLDREFHSGLFNAAESLVGSERTAYMKSVVSHWPNHNNHIHVRYDTSP